jgi:nucleotide-binding universal stress UspA family protein
VNAFHRSRYSEPARETAPPTTGVEADAPHPATSFMREDSRPVLVAVDGSTGAWDALEWASAEAAARDCPLRIIHALTWPLMFDPFGAVWSYRDDAADKEAAELLLIRAELRAREVAHDLRVTTHLQLGPTGPTILSHEHDSSLIVLDRGHSQGLGGALAGSPAARVARHTDCPIAVIGSAQEPSCGPCQTRVVVGLKGTGDRFALLGFAFRAARRRGVGLTVLHAWAPHDDPLETKGRAAEDARKRRHLYDLVAPWRAAFPEVDVAHRLVNASPGRALVDESAGAALLVIGGSRSGRFSHSLLGAPTRAVLHAFSSPVAIVRE